MRTNKKTVAGLAAVGALALSFSLAAPANADYAPSGTDSVGVGGDTPQYDFSFLADGDIQGNLGYNSLGNKNKLISFDSVPDANGRNAFDSQSTPSTPVNLNPTIVLRAGTAPIQRPPSTGVGYTVFNQDTTKQINWLRTGRIPTAAEQVTASNNGWGFLHTIQIATDQIEIVGSTTTNAPAGLTPAQLIKIYDGTYDTWSDIPGYSGSAGAEAIVPLLPPTTSVVRTTLLNTLKAANGNVAIVLAPTVRVVQQNDPTAITTLPAGEKNNAIVSFSAARLGLWNTGFFRNPAVASATPVTPALVAGVKLLDGAPAGGGSSYTDTIGHFIVFRQSDYTGATAQPIWQPGSTKNQIQTLFFDGAAGNPYIKRTSGQTLIASSGAVPQYTDLNNNSAG